MIVSSGSFCHYLANTDMKDLVMGTMNISLPDSLKAFVDEQVASAGYGTSSEYVRELIRREQQRAQLKELLLEGAQSKPVASADKGYFKSLRARTRPRRGKRVV
jgi:antitoxin ParD1/3/4